MEQIFYSNYFMGNKLHRRYQFYAPDAHFDKVINKYNKSLYCYVYHILKNVQVILVAKFIITPQHKIYPDLTKGIIYPPSPFIRCFRKQNVNTMLHAMF